MLTECAASSLWVMDFFEGRERHTTVTVTAPVL